MREYRQESPTNESEERSAQVHRVNAVDRHGDLPAFARLYDDYGLDIDMEIPSPTTGVQSVEQEYQAYITGIRPTPPVDILRFWEVCI
jgi:hypothetical protein